MKKNILFLCLLFFILNNLTANDDFFRQQELLRTFDIKSSFLTDPIYISMKEEMDDNKVKYFIKTLQKGDQFLPILRKMLDDSEVPTAFLYLAMVESGFSVQAYSKARALGLWQFIPGTAKLYDLRIDTYVDERSDPVKSTQAAIAYLENLHKVFGKWYLAAMAYNCGEGCVRRAIAKAETDDISVLLSEKDRYLPKETRMYIRKILMFANFSSNSSFIIENGADHLLNSGSGLGLEVVDVPGGTSLESISELVDIPTKVLKEYNPHLKYYFTPPNVDNYHIYIPHDKKANFASLFDPKKLPKEKFFIHKVKKGDTLLDIAKKYGTSVAMLKDFNKLKSNLININQQLVIPVVLT